MNIYTDHQGLQYYNTKQKLNSRPASWYLHMSESRYNIHYRPGTKMGTPDCLSKRSGEEKSGMNAKFFEQRQLLDLEEDEKDNERNADDIELEGIDVSKWDEHNELWLVPEEHRLEVLRQHHDSQVAGHWRGHRTEQLVSRNFTWDRWSEDVANVKAQVRVLLKIGTSQYLTSS